MQNNESIIDKLDKIKSMPCLFKTTNKEGEDINFNLRLTKEDYRLLYIDCLSDKNEEMGSIEFYIKENKTFLYFLVTQPNFQNKGVASALLETMEYISCLEGVKHIEGKYRPMNEFALPFYKKHGYYVPNEIKDWSVYDETWTMSKELDYNTIIQKGEATITFGNNEEKEIEM